MRTHFCDTWTGGALLFHSSMKKLWANPSSSAISISRDWVLTHGTALDQIMNKSNELSQFVTSIIPGQLTSVPKELAKEMEFSVLREVKPSFERHTGKVVFVWICPLITQTLKVFFNKWDFYNRNMSKAQQLRQVLFLLIRVDCDQSDSVRKILSAEQALRCLQKQIFSQSFTRGAPVEIISSPFGNVWLFNSMTQGIVSNAVGGIIMTDAYVFPHSEGGPVYIVSKSGSRTLIGMVIVTMTWCRNELVHYTFAANLALSLLILQQMHRPTLPTKLVLRHDSSNALDRSVVMVICGSSKGSGILVDKATGTFLTCSHVVEEAPEMEISVITFRGIKGDLFSRTPAKLLFKTPEKLPYDVALLRIKTSELDVSLEPIQFSDAPILQGEPVVAVGFAFFLPTRPTISSGVVSKLLDCMLVTTCCIQGGFSGGPIISQSTGRMLGMVSCNVQSVDNSVHYQRMSLSVPVTILSKPLQQYLLTDNVDALQPLISKDPTVQKIWILDAHPSPKI